LADCEKLCANPTLGGTEADKSRCILVLYLLKPNMAEEQYNQLMHLLQGVGGSTSALQFLKHVYQRFQNLSY